MQMRKSEDLFSNPLRPSAMLSLVAHRRLRLCSLRLGSMVGLLAFSLAGCVPQLTAGLGEQTDGAFAIAADNIPIPTAAPQRALALTADATAPVQTLAEQAALTVLVETSQTAALDPQSVGSASAPIATENDPTIAPVATDASQQAALVASPPAGNLSFFQQLLQKQSQRRADAKKLRIAKAQSAAVRNVARPTATGNKNSLELPGVKRGNKLFGISSEDGDAEEQANILVASAGSLGRMISKSGLLLQTERVQVGCFRPDLIQLLNIVERRYGKRVMVTSGFRSPVRNRRAGGVKNSTHVYCKAADIQIEGISKWDLAKYLRTIPGRGGVGTYCRTNSVHIDVGTQRDWHHPCRRTRSKSRKKA